MNRFLETVKNVSIYIVTRPASSKWHLRNVLICTTIASFVSKPTKRKKSSPERQSEKIRDPRPELQSERPSDVYQ